MACVRFALAHNDAGYKESERVPYWTHGLHWCSNQKEAQYQPLRACKELGSKFGRAVMGSHASQPNHFCTVGNLLDVAALLPKAS